MSYNFSPPPGITDILSEELFDLYYIKKSASKLFSIYGYKEIYTPILEYSEIFQHNIGKQNDLVNKEMYTFLDHGKRKLALRPEGTAGAIRALLKADLLNNIKQNRVYYFGPMFRGDRPASGRKRQFHQLGVESIGNPNPYHDAECIIMLMHYLKTLKIIHSNLLLNTKGTKKDILLITSTMKQYFNKHIEEMCNDCKKRLLNNTLRILDCKKEKCKNIIKQSPVIYTLLCKESKLYFDQVINILNKNNIKFQIAPHLIRGLDYYEHTTFEVQHNLINKIDSIVGGGRYKINIKNFNAPIDGVGFAAGVERLILAQNTYKFLKNKPKQHKFIFIINPPNCSEKVKMYSFILLQYLRKNNIFTIANFKLNQSILAQMRLCNKQNIDIVIIIGNQELITNTLNIKNMITKKQTIIDKSKIINYLSHN